ncbi:hypothetical protein X275_01135 [Marinitoga sp. 1197]|uniref:hypothetical protein n=1 Tax=Marinitoga sp. 1197 TaxID=1428449 RepID=UPI000640D4E6|nr:hypothetical protein [Marinitoga sp. 1197]AJW76953.1 hypothetical protein UF08_64 [Marinitoga camini virus 1]KLO24030.1 hypothetical protein X275_01135 [Marinitoga sp. 1197]
MEKSVHNISASLIAKLVNEPVTSYEKLYKKFKEGVKFAPRAYSVFFDSVEKMINGIQESEIYDFLNSANYINHKYIDWKNKNIETFTKFANFLKSKKWENKLFLYKGNTLKILFEYGNDYEKGVCIKLTPHFVLKNKNKKYLLYTIPSSKKIWKSDHVKALYAIGTELIKENNLKYDGFYVYHISQEMLVHNIGTKKLFNKVKMNAKYFAISVLDRAKKEKVQRIISIAEEFNGFDELEF